PPLRRRAPAGRLPAAGGGRGRERSEGEAVTADARETRTARMMRVAFYGAGTWGAVTLALLLAGVVHERVLGPWPMVVPFFSTVGLGALCNVLGVRMVPEVVRDRIKPGLRGLLWRSTVGAWLARRLGAPERSQLAGASAFR